MCLSTRSTSKWHFVLGLPNGSPEILKVGTLSWLWGPITLCSNLQLRWGLKQGCSPHQELFNSMWHATYKQGKRVDSWLLVVGIQIANLTLNLSVGHNFCFKCPNGSHEPILDIYISITFQWYKKLSNPMDFDPCNCYLKIRESIGTSSCKVKAHLGVWKFILSHSPTLLGI